MNRSAAAVAEYPTELLRPPPEATASAAADGRSARLRHKRYAVLAAQSATAFLVAVAISTTLVTRFHQLSPFRVMGLVAMGLIDVGWTLYCTRDATRYVLADHRESRESRWPSLGAPRSILYLGLQFVLAESIIVLATPVGTPGLLWLVLLPPVGFAVMLMRFPAILCVTTLSILLNSVNVGLTHGWAMVPLTAPAFAVAVLFTVVFTHIAVSAEKSRGEAEELATALGAANEKLRQYAAQAEELAATRERNRVAREIHDGLGHCLSVAHVQLEAARATFDRAPDDARAAIDQAQSVVRQGLQEIRRSVSALRESPLQGRSLPEALRRLASESESAGVSVTLEILGDERPLEPPVAVTLYRAAQEGLTNCRKHAKTSAAELTLDFRRSDRVGLAVRDHGVGSNGVHEGFGLLGLRERARFLGGDVRIHTDLGRGFTLELEALG